MSNLSDLIFKPYKGLAGIAGGLALTLPAPTLQLEASDTTSAAQTFPQFVLKNNRQAPLAGGSLIWHCKNDAGNFVSAVVQQSSLLTLTAGAESSALIFTLLGGGAAKSLHMRGDLSGFIPNATAEAWTLGATGQRFATLFVGNGTIAGEVTQDAGGMTVGTSSNHALELKSNNVVRATMDTLGRWGLLGTPPTGAVLGVVGTHPSSSATVNGVAVTCTIPGTAATAAAFYAQPTIAAGATTANGVAFDVGDPVLGSGAAITNLYGLRVGALASGLNNVGVSLQIAAKGGNNWNVYASGSAPSYFAGPVGIGTPAGVVPTTALEVNAAGTTPALALRGASAAATGTLLLVQSSLPQSSSIVPMVEVSAWAQSVSGPLPVFRVYSDGKTVLTPNNVTTYTSLYNGLLTVRGRIAQPVNADFNQFLTNWAVSHLIYDGSGVTTTVADTAMLVGSGVVFNNLAVGASAARAYGYLANVVAGSAGGTGKIVGLGSQVTASGTGTLYGMEASASTSSGLASVSAIYAYASASLGATRSVIFDGWCGSALRGLSFDTTNLGSLDSAVYVESTVNVGTAVLHYKQHAGSTADFLRFVGSGGGNAFVVDAAGNLASAGLTVQGNRDVMLGPVGALTTMSAGFPYMPAAAGAPSGAPTARTGFVPFYYDLSANKLYVYNGSWKAATLA